MMCPLMCIKKNFYSMEDFSELKYVYLYLHLVFVLPNEKQKIGINLYCDMIHRKNFRIGWIDKIVCVFY